MFCRRDGAADGVRADGVRADGVRAAEPKTRLSSDIDTIHDWDPSRRFRRVSSGAKSPLRDNKYIRINKHDQFWH